MLPVAPSIAEVRAAVFAARSAGKRIGFVPTMGALHAGHAELVRVAKRLTDFVVVSVFVNPTQFGPNEDFARYPRTLDEDRRISAEAGGDLVFAPSAAEMYPPNAVAFVEVPKLDAVLCGPRRPGHFRGVCTVVLKLFNIVRPDVAVFGAKDAQQAIILQKMVADLNVPVEMVIAPTVREADGLAMSSRNRYLSAAERAEAPKIFHALKCIEARVAAGETDVARLESALLAELRTIPGARVDYANILDAELLTPMGRLNRPALAAVAVFLGTTRLIDNLILSPRSDSASVMPIRSGETE
ncbi:MAG: pantoate--beta-alanine ligase [Fimbriiglobus sp.]|jgi:pantoate--beta-alanine ligase|nr:pantoate--beta-alanine ligase [Fimbriiglobus sp.]